MSGGVGPGVGRTAVWTAGLRATESTRPDRLLDDPYAAAFVAAYGSGGLAAQTASAGGAPAQKTSTGGATAQTASAGGVAEQTVSAGRAAAQTPSAGRVAAQTASAGGLAAETASVPPGASEFVAIRTRFYDDQVGAATAAGLRQIVLLAAGL